MRAGLGALHRDNYDEYDDFNYYVNHDFNHKFNFKLFKLKLQFDFKHKFDLIDFDHNGLPDDGWNRDLSVSRGSVGRVLQPV